MHETSIIYNIFNTLENEFSESKLDKLSAIHLKIGPLSNIEPMLLTNAFEAYKEASNIDRAMKIEIKKTEILIECEKCKCISKVIGFKFMCTKCGRPSKNIISGNELLIHKVFFNE